MNHIQILLFFGYVSCILCGGAGLYAWINPRRSSFINNDILLGEMLLLGSIFTIGMMLFLSVVHLYYPPFLWSVVCLNLTALLSRDVRSVLSSMMTAWKFSLPRILFAALLGLFFVRNIFFVVDVDSHSTYLFAQKLWLLNGTSVFSKIGLDDRIYSPHFDCVPYGLTLSLFGNDTIFPLLINFLWRAISLVLVFGYVRHRFNGWYALAGVMFILFNDHFMMSCANNCVLINGALIALVFAAAYNFWEARAADDPFRLCLALIFLSQFVANKFLYLPGMLFCLVIGLFIQPMLWRGIKDLLRSKGPFFCLVLAVFFSALWFIKNQLSTGLAMYPYLAWHYEVLGWTREKGISIQQYLRGVSVPAFLKYATYFFIWPGIQTAKITIIAVLFLPVLFIGSFVRKNFEPERFLEICFWLSLAFFMVLGSCLLSHQDPRYYRYPIAIYTFAAIFVLDYAARNILGLNRVVLGICLLLFAAKEYDIVLLKGGTDFVRPSLEDNIKVLANKMHFEDVYRKYYPFNIKASQGYEEASSRTKNAAWDMTSGNLSAFLLPSPMSPHLNFWMTNVIKWPSYENKELILADLGSQKIDGVMRVRSEFEIVSNAIYADEAVYYNRYPGTIAFPYTMPAELIGTHY